MHLLPTGGLSRWRCSSIQACRFSGMGSMDYSLKAAMQLSSIAIGVGSASMPSGVRQGALAGSDRKRDEWGKRGSVRVDHGVRRIFNQKKVHNCTWYTQ